MKRYFLITTQYAPMDCNPIINNYYVSCYTLPSPKEIAERIFVGMAHSLAITFAMPITKNDFENGEKRLIFDED